MIDGKRRNDSWAVEKLKVVSIVFFYALHIYKISSLNRNFINN